MLMPRSKFFVFPIFCCALIAVVNCYPPGLLPHTSAAAANHSSISNQSPATVSTTKIIPTPKLGGTITGGAAAVAAAATTSQQASVHTNASTVATSQQINLENLPQTLPAETKKPNQKVTDMLASMIITMPVYANSLLNQTLYPFIAHCDDSPKNSIVCMGYIEMLSTVYNDGHTPPLPDNITRIFNDQGHKSADEFCKQFPGIIPTATSAAPAPGHQSFKELMENQLKCGQFCALFNDQTFKLELNVPCQLIAAGYAAAKISMTSSSVSESAGSNKKNGTTTSSAAASPAVVLPDKVTNKLQSTTTTVSTNGAIDKNPPNKSEPNANNNATNLKVADSEPPTDELNEDADGYPQLDKEEDDMDDSDGNLGAFEPAPPPPPNEKSTSKAKNLNENDGVEKMLSDNERLGGLKYSHDDQLKHENGQPEKNNDSIDHVDVTDGDGDDDDDSYFFEYFLFSMFLVIVFYVAYHNRSKLLGLMLEGRRGSSGGGGGGGFNGSRGKGGIGRRKHTAAYRKLDTNLEEAISSSAASRTSQIIY